jgi:hydroxyacylglutathione hydrolase
MADRESASEASSKVQEVAANMQQAAATRKRITGSKADAIARRYFAAIDAHDIAEVISLWAPGGRQRVHGQLDAPAPEGVHASVGELIGAIPDLHMQVLSTIAAGERCGVHWRLTGTFAGPGTIGGVAPTGRPVELEGFDLLGISDGLIRQNDVFVDSMTVAREVGLMPPQGSSAEARMTAAFNAKTRVGQRLGGGDAQLVAQGVWVVQGQPGRCNVYLIEDDGGVTQFDAGARTMTRAVASAAAKLGGLRRIVLGHAHPDHRGSAPELGAPVLCHPDEVQDAEGDGGRRYWPEGLSGLPIPLRYAHRLMMRYAWDAGPVRISGTLSEGDEVAGFRVIELPGHAPGQIGLWRESDHLALSSDCFYTIDMWGRRCEARVPEPMYNFDTEQARASIRKLAALEPAVAWSGHDVPLTGDVRDQLERAADAD